MFEKKTFVKLIKNVFISFHYIKIKHSNLKKPDIQQVTNQKNPTNDNELACQIFKE